MSSRRGPVPPPHRRLAARRLLPTTFRRCGRALAATRSRSTPPDLDDLYDEVYGDPSPEVARDPEAAR